MVGDLLAALAGPGSPVPVFPVHSATLPGWVGPLDLVVAVSMSGRAHGPLAVAAEAARRGCRLLTVGAGGLAARRGLRAGARRARPGARDAALVAVEPVGAGRPGAGRRGRARPRARRRRDPRGDRRRGSTTSPRLPARRRSRSSTRPSRSRVDLAGSIPLVLGAGDLAGVAARRARGRSWPATPGTRPSPACCPTPRPRSWRPSTGRSCAAADDLFVDDIVDDALGGAAPTTLRLLLLRDDDEHQEPDVARVADVVRDTATEGGVRVSELRAAPGPDLARLAGLVALTDFASVYLALGLGLDPATSPHVADLKERMRVSAVRAAPGRSSPRSPRTSASPCPSSSRSRSPARRRWLAEGVHSLADSGNQVLLLVGGRRAQRGRRRGAPVRLRADAVRLRVRRVDRAVLRRRPVRDLRGLAQDAAPRAS